MAWKDISDQWPAVAAYALEREDGGVVVLTYDSPTTILLNAGHGLDLDSALEAECPWGGPVLDFSHEDDDEDEGPVGALDFGSPITASQYPTGVGVNVFGLRRNSGALSYPNREQVVIEMRTQLAHLAKLGVRCVRLCLESYDDHGPRPSQVGAWAEYSTLGGPAYSTASDQVADPWYRHNTKDLIRYAGQLGITVVVCFRQDPNNAPNGIPAASAVNLWQQAMIDWGDFPHVVVDCCPGSDDEGSDGVAAQFAIVSAVRELEMEANLPPHLCLVAGTGAGDRGYRLSEVFPHMTGDTMVWIKQHQNINPTAGAKERAAAREQGHNLIVGEFGPSVIVGSVDSTDADGLSMTLGDCDRLVEECRTNGEVCLAWAHAHNCRSPMLRAETAPPGGRGPGIGIDYDEETEWGKRWRGYLV